MERLISQYQGPYDNEFIYLDLPTHLLASHGTRASVGAIVLLERDEQRVLRLTDISRGEVLRRLLIQNFSPHGLSQGSTEVLHKLIAQVPTFKLSYSDGESAIDQLT